MHASVVSKLMHFLNVSSGNTLSYVRLLISFLSIKVEVKLLG